MTRHFVDRGATILENHRFVAFRIANDQEATRSFVNGVPELRQQCLRDISCFVRQDPLLIRICGVTMRLVQHDPLRVDVRSIAEPISTFEKRVPVQRYDCLDVSSVHKFRQGIVSGRGFLTTLFV